MYDMIFTSETLFGGHMYVNSYTNKLKQVEMFCDLKLSALDTHFQGI